MAKRVNARRWMRTGKILRALRRQRRILDRLRRSSRPIHNGRSFINAHIRLAYAQNWTTTFHLNGRNQQP